MNRNHIHPYTLILCFAAFVLMLTTSCSTSKKLNYFNDLPDTDTYELKAMPVPGACHRTWRPARYLFYRKRPGERRIFQQT